LKLFIKFLFNGHGVGYGAHKVVSVLQNLGEDCGTTLLNSAQKKKEEKFGLHKN